MRFKKYLEIIEEDNLVENARVMGEYLLSRIQGLAEKYPAFISNPRGKGLICAMDVLNGDIRKKLLEHIFENGAIMLPCGERTIRFRPSLIIEKKHIDECFDIIEKSIKLL